MSLTSDKRPAPSVPLQPIEAVTKTAQRGKLKIFFGGCSGAGKTYAMLSAGQQRLAEGMDVVAGIVDTHGREEPRKLLASFPLIAPAQINHRGSMLKEFDIDAAKQRKPALLLLDELAHTNAPGSRHPKRWQDVEELLDAGISVYTTLNVQHLESLNDLVAGSTGISVRETVPDSVFDGADDVVLVDINADELLLRLKEGKVCTTDQTEARSTTDDFFKKSNLIALREMALRRTTERVDAQMDAYKTREGISDAVAVNDKVMVCIGPDPLSAKLVRTAKRMASSLKAPWVAAYVENARHYRLNDRGKAAVDSFLRMAERIGGKSIVLQGNSATEEILAYARANGITKIIIGKQEKPRWKDILFGSLVEAVLRGSKNIDLYVVTGEVSERKSVTGSNDLFEFKPKLYGYALLSVILSTLAGVLLDPFVKPIELAMIYLMGVVLVASRFGRGPSIICSMLSAGAFNYFFINPIYTLSITSHSFWITFLVMSFTSMVISLQSSKLRLQAMFARQRERDTQALYMLTRELASTRGHHNISQVSARNIAEMFDVDVTIWLPDGNGPLAPIIGSLPEFDIIKETGVMQWCFKNRQPAGRDTQTIPSAIALYLPLTVSDKSLGVLGILPKSTERHFTLEEISSLETFASLLGSALGRAHDTDATEKSRAQAEDAYDRGK